MCQNCSISFSADPGGCPKKSVHLGHPWYNYDVQSKCKLRYEGDMMAFGCMIIQVTIQVIHPEWMMTADDEDKTNVDFRPLGEVDPTPMCKM